VRGVSTAGGHLQHGDRRAILSSMRVGLVAIGTCLAVVATPWPGAPDPRPPEARVSLDLRDADVRQIAAALLEVSGLQGAIDPGIECTLTLKVHRLGWLKTLQTVLNACGLGYEEEGTVVRIATRARLLSEAAERRRRRELREETPSGRVALVRLSYARAREMAPLLGKLLTPHADVVYDERTNTLILVE
jgi:type IV pilus assembly protein PilQ